MLKEIDIFENTDVVRYNISCQYSDAAKYTLIWVRKKKLPNYLKST